jgi:hypothetical protein
MAEGSRIATPAKPLIRFFYLPCNSRGGVCRLFYITENWILIKGASNNYLAMIF